MHLGSSHTKGVAEALEHQEKVLKLIQKPGQRKDHESGKDSLSDKPSISSPNTVPEPRSLIPLPNQCHGPGPFAWALLQQATCSEDQIDFASLPVLAMQKSWQETQDRDATSEKDVPLALADTSASCRCIRLGGGRVR